MLFRVFASPQLLLQWGGGEDGLPGADLAGKVWSLEGRPFLLFRYQPGSSFRSAFSQPLGPGVPYFSPANLPVFATRVGHLGWGGRHPVWDPSSWQNGAQLPSKGARAMSLQHHLLPTAPEVVEAPDGLDGPRQEVRASIASCAQPTGGDLLARTQPSCSSRKMDRKRARPCLEEEAEPPFLRWTTEAQATGACCRIYVRPRREVGYDRRFPGPVP